MPRPLAELSSEDWTQHLVAVFPESCGSFTVPALKETGYTWEDFVADTVRRIYKVLTPDWADRFAKETGLHAFFLTGVLRETGAFQTGQRTRRQIFATLRGAMREQIKAGFRELPSVHQMYDTAEERTERKQLGKKVVVVRKRGVEITKEHEAFAKSLRQASGVLEILMSAIPSFERHFPSGTVAYEEEFRLALGRKVRAFLARAEGLVAAGEKEVRRKEEAQLRDDLVQDLISKWESLLSDADIRNIDSVSQEMKLNPFENFVEFLNFLTTRQDTMTGTEEARIRPLVSQFLMVLSHIGHHLLAPVPRANRPLDTILEQASDTWILIRRRLGIITNTDPFNELARLASFMRFLRVDEFCELFEVAYDDSPVEA